MTCYGITEDSLLILAELCRVTDRLDALAAAVDRDGVTIPGSRGQTIAHPALAEARSHQVVMARLVRTLALPPELPAASVSRLSARRAG